MIETVQPLADLSDPIPSVEILGHNVHRVDMGAALDAIRGFVRAGGPHHIVTADASMLVLAQDDVELSAIIRAADLVTPDSSGILWAASRNRKPLAAQVSGVEIAERLCAESAAAGFRLFFLGAAPGVAKAAADRMRDRYAGAQIVGARDGFFKPDETQSVVSEVRDSGADILLVAMGIPKQEKWIKANRDALGCSVLIGVGGTFDVLSGQVKRAPKLIQALRLEWLWRVASNPSKFSKVMLLPRFVRLVNSQRR